MNKEMGGDQDEKTGRTMDDFLGRPTLNPALWISAGPIRGATLYRDGKFPAMWHFWWSFTCRLLLPQVDDRKRLEPQVEGRRCKPKSEEPTGLLVPLTNVGIAEREGRHEAGSRSRYSPVDVSWSAELAVELVWRFRPE